LSKARSSATFASAHSLTFAIRSSDPEKTDRSGEKSGQYAGTLFEQMTLVLLDAVFHALWRDSGINADQMYQRHANLG